MSKRRILKLFEKNGRGRFGLRTAGQMSQSAFLLSWTIQQPPSTGTRLGGLVKLIGGPLPDPLGDPAGPERARRSTGHRQL